MLICKKQRRFHWHVLILPRLPPPLPSHSLTHKFCPVFLSVNYIIFLLFTAAVARRPPRRRPSLISSYITHSLCVPSPMNAFWPVTHFLLLNSFTRSVCCCCSSPLLSASTPHPSCASVLFTVLLPSFSSLLLNLFHLPVNCWWRSWWLPSFLVRSHLSPLTNERSFIHLHGGGLSINI